MKLLHTEVRLMLKVVMISPLPPEKHGESLYTTKLIKHLIHYKKIQIQAIGGEGSEPLPMNIDRVTTHSIWRQRDLRYPLKLLDFIRKSKPHIVHVQFGPYGELFGGFFGEPMLLLLLLLRIVGIPTTITLHSTWMPEQVNERIGTYNRLRKISFLGSIFFRIYMKVLNWGTTSVQLSTVKIDSLLRRKFLEAYGFNPQKVQEIPHPFSLIEKKIDPLLAEKELSVQGRHVVLLFGFIRPGKGIEIAIDAINRVRTTIPNVLLLVAGRPLDSRGEIYLEQLKLQVNELGLEKNVRFDTKHIPDSDVPIYFSAASILLVPYTESVGASGPIHNNAGYGVPIIAADVGYHMKETLKGMLTLFQNCNHLDLTKKVIELLADETLRKDIGTKQCKHTEQKSWNQAAKLTMQNYKEIIG